MVQAAKKYKKLNFIIKPHPNDDHLIWEKFEKKYKNIHVIYGLDISEFLKISNLHITVEGCNTTFEALYNNISVGEICLEKTFAKKEMNNITLNLCENKIHTFKNFDNLIYDIFFNKKNFINKGKLKTYIKFHFHRVDDKRYKIC